MKSKMKLFDAAPLSLTFIFLALLSACATTRISMPEWLNNFQAAFPEEEYIAQRAAGKSMGEAKAKAAQALAEYFSVRIQSQTDASLRLARTDGNVENERRVQSEISVSSDVSVNALEFSGPWQNPKTKIWHCAAFINRQNAWMQYESTVRAAKEKFRPLYEAAQKETDALFRLRRYGEAKKAGEDFLTTLSFARLISPKMAKMEFGTDAAALAQTSVLQEQAKKKCAFFIRVQNDVSGIVRSAISEALAECGFIVVQKQSESSCLADAAIQYNAERMSGLAVLSPSVVITLAGKGGAAYTFSDSAERAGALNESVARTKAAENVAKLISENFSKSVKAALLLQ